MRNKALAAVGFSGLALLSACAMTPTPTLSSGMEQPRAPYYSLDFGMADSREAALQRMAALWDVDGIRAEGRSNGWYLRAGAWQTEAAAKSALAKFDSRARGVLQIDNPVPWILADGSIVAVPASPMPKRRVTSFTPSLQQPPPPYYSVEYGAEATREAALKRIAELSAVEKVRAEQHGDTWLIRAGAWDRIEPAERAMFASKGAVTAVVKIEAPVAWVLADGSTAPPRAAP